MHYAPQWVTNYLPFEPNERFFFEMCHGRAAKLLKGDISILNLPDFQRNALGFEILGKLNMLKGERFSGDEQGGMTRVMRLVFGHLY